MKGKNITLRILKYCAVLIALSTCGNLSAETRNVITVVKSSDNNYYNRTIKSLVSLFSDSPSLKIIDTTELESQRVSEVRLFIALGMKATRQRLPEYPEQHNISACITQYQMRELPIRTGFNPTVLRDQPLERYLAFSQSPDFARYYSITTNSRVAHALGLSFQTNLKSVVS